MSTNIAAFIVVLGVLIFFHELGHFLVAKFFGVGVTKFSLGFGPKLLSKKVGVTEYCVSIVPLGGYVKMMGEEEGSQINSDDLHLSFTHKHIFKRILIVAAGPIFNLFLAIIIFFGIFQVSGSVILESVIGDVEKDSPAYTSDIRANDRITAINSISIESWEEMAKIISDSDGKNIAVSVLRGESIITVDVKPKLIIDKNIFGESVKRYVIGIKSAGSVISKSLNPIQAFAESITQTYVITKLTLISIVKMVQGIVSTKTLGGPIMIAQLAGEQARQGTVSLLFFIAILSINLAVLNFLPIPVLDGGHLLFFFIEAITGHPVNEKTREFAQKGGICVLVTLMVFVFYNDIMRNMDAIQQFFGKIYGSKF